MQPRAFVIAGPNGSGKSTLIRQLQSATEYSFPTNYINADDIERSLSPARAASKEQREKQAFQIARQLRRRYREEGSDHAIETVFSHSSNLLDLMRLRAVGFSVTLCYVATTNPSLNVERVRRRVLAGGHYVPEEKVRERYIRSLRFLPRAAEIADVSYVYDNSDTLTLIGYFTKNHWNPTVTQVPPYLVDAFAIPVETRRQERKTIAVLGGDDGLELPDEEGGEYQGIIVAAGKHYVVQEVVEGKLSSRYRHDALWLASPPRPDWAGKVAMVRYGGGAFGLAGVSFLATP